MYRAEVEHLNACIHTRDVSPLSEGSNISSTLTNLEENIKQKQVCTIYINPKYLYSTAAIHTKIWTSKMNLKVVQCRMLLRSH